MVSELEVILRLTAAAFLGAVVGLERERHSQPAGLRTHTILTVGAALAMCLSIQLAAQTRAGGGGGDPTRLAAQVVSGIGFLGAGAIIRFGANIKGLTTATSLWTVAIVGLTVGAGFYWTGLYATAVLLFTLTVMDRLEKRVIVHTSTHAISVRAADRPDLVGDMRAVLAALDVEVKAFSFTKNIQSGEINMKILAKIRDKANEEKLIERISGIPGCKDIGME